MKITLFFKMLTACMIGFMLGLFIGLVIISLLFPHTAFIDTYFHHILFVSGAIMSVTIASLAIKHHHRWVVKYQLKEKSIYQRFSFAFSAGFIAVLTGIGFLSLLP